MEIFRTFLTTMEIMAGSCARLFSALRTAISFPSSKTWGWAWSKKGKVDIPGHYAGKGCAGYLDPAMPGIGGSYQVQSGCQVHNQKGGWFFCGLCWWQLSLQAVGDSHRGMLLSSHRIERRRLQVCRHPWPQHI